MDSSASFLTSSATTAKPLPASPARAASIAAFKARRLVWSAIPAMVSTKPVIPATEPARSSTASLTLTPERDTSAIILTMSSRAAPPFSAALDISWARSPVSAADFAPAWAPLETSSIPALASWTALEVSWVLRTTLPARARASWTDALERSAAVLISSARVRTLPAPDRMLTTASAVPSIMAFSASATPRISSIVVRTVRRVVRSPVSATRLASSATLRRGLVRLREKSSTTTMEASSTAAMPM